MVPDKFIPYGRVLQWLRKYRWLWLISRVVWDDNNTVRDSVYHYLRIIEGESAKLRYFLHSMTSDLPQTKTTRMKII